MRSVAGALQAFEFATFVGDYAAAETLLDSMQSDLRWRMPSADLAQSQSYRDAILAIQRADYPVALDALERAIVDRPVSDRDSVVLTMLLALVKTPEKLDDKGRAEITAALNRTVPAGFR